MTSRVLLAGAGRWGTVHARKLADRADASLAVIWDQDRERAATLAADTGVKTVIRAAGAIPADIDAAVVAVSSDAHVDVTLELLRRGIPVLLEKPLAIGYRDIERLDAAVRVTPHLVHAAMIERHNPAFTAVRDQIGNPLFVQTERLAPFTARSLDTDVVLDLMIHDLDLILDLVAGEVSEVRAVGGPVLSEQPDMAHVRIEFDSGCVAVLASSRVSFKAIRTLRTFGRSAYHSVDLADRHGQRALRTRGDSGDLQLSLEPVVIPDEDALQRQHDAFLDRVRRGEGDPRGWDQARSALDLALRIQSDIRDNLGRWLDA